MAAVALSTLAADITSATPATVAAAIGGSATEDNIAALVKLLTVMGGRPGEAIPLLKLADDVQLLPK